MARAGNPARCRRAVSVLPVWVTPTRSPRWSACSEYESPYSLLASQKAASLSRFSSLSTARRMKHQSHGAEQPGLNDPTPAQEPACSFFPQHSERRCCKCRNRECGSSRESCMMQKSSERAACLGHAHKETAHSPRRNAHSEYESRSSPRVDHIL